MGSPVKIHMDKKAEEDIVALEIIFDNRY